MNVGWIYPHRQRCGITRYSIDYINVLRPAINVIDVDPRWWIVNHQRFISSIDKCDILHIQYDTAAFMNKGRDFYGAMLQQVKAPVIATLHEVYNEDPAVFPRSRLRGTFPLLQIKRMAWDLRHPVQVAFARHLQAHFHAQTLIVHHRYHVDILSGKGIPRPLLRIVPIPIKTASLPDRFVFPELPLVRIAATGFINPAFDYELLFDVLERIQRPWSFTWIGGIRSVEHQPLLDMILTRVTRCGWNDRFVITGWIDESELSPRLASADIILSLFKFRSSSASISRVMGDGKPVIATRLPLTEEIASTDAAEAPPLLLTSSDPQQIIAVIEDLITDTALQQRLFKGLSAYIRNNAIDRMATALVEIYRGMLIR